MSAGTNAERVLLLSSVHVRFVGRGEHVDLVHVGLEVLGEALEEHLAGLARELHVDAGILGLERVADHLGRVLRVVAGPPGDRALFLGRVVELRDVGVGQLVLAPRHASAGCRRAGRPPARRPSGTNVPRVVMTLDLLRMPRRRPRRRAARGVGRRARSGVTAHPSATTRVSAGRPHGGQQVALGHAHRDVVVLALVAERAGHPAARRLDRLASRPGSRAGREARPASRRRPSGGRARGRTALRPAAQRRVPAPASSSRATNSSNSSAVPATVRAAAAAPGRGTRRATSAGTTARARRWARRAPRNGASAAIVPPPRRAPRQHPALRKVRPQQNGREPSPRAPTPERNRRDQDALAAPRRRPRNNGERIDEEARIRRCAP